MKNLITLIGCVLILLATFLQVAQNQIIYTKLSNIDAGISAFKDKVSREGMVTSEDSFWLKSFISRTSSIDEKDIIIQGDSTKIPKGDLVHFTVSVNIPNLLAAKEFWGFDQDETKKTYTLDRYVVSAKEDDL